LLPVAVGVSIGWGYRIRKKRNKDEVLAYNPMIVNPNLIYVGMIIYLPEIL